MSVLTPSAAARLAAVYAPVLSSAHPCCLRGLDAAQRDRELRALARDLLPELTCTLSELWLQVQFILRGAPLLPEYPYLVGWEWEVVPGFSQYGRGDLLFTDGAGRYVVVEVKSIVTGNRNRKRNSVEEQAERYAELVSTVDPHAESVESFVFTNDWICPGLRRPVRWSPARELPPLS